MRLRRVAGWLGLGALAAGGGLWLAVQRSGAALLDGVDALAGPRAPVGPVRIVRYGPDRAQAIRLYAPLGVAGPLPVFVFFHGGGWSSGSPADYGFVARAIGPRGYVVALAGYRLDAGGRYPAMLQDTAAAIAAVRRSVAASGGDPDRIVVGGHSAGAYNAVAAVLDPRWLREAEVLAGAVRGIVGLAGPYDFYPFDTESSRNAFGSVGAGPDSQPVHHVRPGLPPVLLVHGTADTVVRPRNSRRLAALLAEAGIPVRLVELPSGSHTDPLVRLARPFRRDARTYRAVGEFLDAVTSPSVQGANR